MRLIAVLLILASCGGAAPSVSKVEPPNWWVRHTRNPIQVLLTGSDLNGATIVPPPAAFRVQVRQASANGHYLFLYLTIDASARPGTYQFQVRKGGSGTEFAFALDAPLDPAGRFQGYSPDDVIYLVMPDRFANGDPANDSPAEYRQPADRKAVSGYHGGDLRGMRDHLGYLKDLGVTGIWMTPVYKNSSTRGTPYHGYHTVDFYDVEPRFGTMREFREFVDAAHGMGIKVVQDQVANHCGPDHEWVNDPPTPTWFNDLSRMPRLRNNFDIAALADPYARPSRREVPLRGWFAGHLPDFDQTDPLMADYLIQNALWWIGMTGIDAIRQDTYPYVDRPFWEKWQSAIDRRYPNMVVTGEITAPSPAVLSFFDGGTRREGADTRLKSMLDFPLERAIRDVFAQGQPMTQLTDILAQDFLYRRPDLLVTFIGNHDQPRFLTIAGSDTAKLRMAQAFLLATRRVPHLYYGDEIAMGAGTDRTDRSIRADFPGGWPGDPSDAFVPAGRTGEAARTFDWVRDLLHFRAAHPALRRGALVNLLVNKDQYAFLRTDPAEYVLVVFNRAGTPLSLPVDDLKVGDGLEFRAMPASQPPITVQGGKLAIAGSPEVGIYWAKR